MALGFVRDSSAEFVKSAPGEPTPPDTSYERDFAGWCMRQAALVRKFGPDCIDRENIAEELESMGRAVRHKIESLTMHIVEHLLKLQFWPEETAERSRAGWKREVRVWRIDLARQLRDNDSLRAHYADTLARAWPDARGLVLKDFEAQGIDRPLPEQCPYDTNDVLAQDWHPTYGQQKAVD